MKRESFGKSLARHKETIAKHETTFRGGSKMQVNDRDGRGRRSRRMTQMRRRRRRKRRIGKRRCDQTARKGGCDAKIRVVMLNSLDFMIWVIVVVMERLIRIIEIVRCKL